MSDPKNWTDYVLDGQAWLRFLFMLLFAPLLGCVGFMVLCLALFQFCSVLANGESNPQLRDLGRDLSRLGTDIVAFLTYNTDRKPFPLGEVPADSPQAGKTAESKQDSKPAAPQASETPEGSDTAKAAPRKKTATKKKTRSTGATTSRSPSSTPRRKTTTRKKTASRKKKPATRSARNQTNDVPKQPTQPDKDDDQT